MEPGEIKRDMFCVKCNKQTKHSIWKKGSNPEGSGKNETFRVYFDCRCSVCNHESKKDLLVDKWNELVMQNEKERAKFEQIPKGGVKREMYCKNCNDVNIHLIVFPKHDSSDNTIEYGKKCTYCDEGKKLTGGVKFVREKMSIETWNAFIKGGN